MHNIYTYNPTGEMAIANGMLSYMPPKNLRRFEEDLAFLPAFFASEEDTIITPYIPDHSFLEKWKKLGLTNMNYVCGFDSPLKECNYLIPWSWNPAIHHKTRHLKKLCSDTFKSSPNFKWQETYRNFFSRDTTNKVQGIIHQTQGSDNKIAIQTPAISITSIDELDKWLLGQNAAILKTPWSSSGRGIHRIDVANNRPANYPWIKGAIKQQGYITAEPLLDKVFDFSFQLNIQQNGHIEFLGFSYFINDDKGHFTGGHINWPHQPNEISQFLSDEVLREATQKLINALQQVNPHEYYEGPIGIDGIVYKTKVGELKIHPCVDINWRYNMGIVNIALPKYVEATSIGKWKVSSFARSEWNNFIEQNEKSNPLIIDNHKIISGFINMTPPNKEAIFGVWMEVWPR